MKGKKVNFSCIENIVIPAKKFVKIIEKAIYSLVNELNEKQGLCISKP